MNKGNSHHDSEAFIQNYDRDTINTDIEDQDFRNKRYNDLYTTMPRNYQASIKIQVSKLKRILDHIKSKNELDSETRFHSVKEVLTYYRSQKKTKNQPKK